MQKALEKGEYSTRVEVELATAEATRLAVFDCRGLKVIGCLLCVDGDIGKTFVARRPVAADKKTNQP